MSTQPTEAHRKLWTALYNLAHREIFEDYAESSDGPATQLIADSEARAVEAATVQLRSELNYAKASETLYHDEGTAALAALAAEREKVRVLREALESLAYWSRNKTESRITLRNRIAAALAATEEKP
jgi:hypothetical protein